MINIQVIQRAQDFLKTISRNDRVAIIHDTDPDGVFSAVIIAKCIEKLRGKRIELHIPLEKEQYGITERMIKQIQKHKITKLIALDFSAEQNLPALKTIEKQADILVIDHHKIYTDYQTKKTILYKPQYFTKIEPSTYCTAKLAYDLTGRLTNVSDLDWMAATACIADIATAPWKDWLSKIFQKYNIKKEKEFFKTKLGKIAAIICSLEVYDVRLIPEYYKTIYKTKKPDDIFKSKLGKYNKIIDNELNKHIRLFKTKAKKHGELYIYEMSSKYRIHSPVSTLLALKNPHKTIIIINKTNKLIAVSARREDSKIAVNKLLENAIKGFKNANAGGHTPAAGAGFPKKYLKKFKERIVKTYE